jgi:hypothetical protein
MKQQGEITKMLSDAAIRLGRDRVRALLPQHMAISISAHDTGCQIWIRLCDKPESATVADICAWAGSIWYSSAYEFNDRGRLLGFNPETDFAMGPIEEFFRQVEAALVDASVNALANHEQQLEQENQAHAKRLGHFREMFRKS